METYPKGRNYLMLKEPQASMEPWKRNADLENVSRDDQAAALQIWDVKNCAGNATVKSLGLVPL